MSGKPQIDERLYQSIGERYKAGEKVASLATEYGIKRDALYLILRKLGLPRNHKGGAKPLSEAVIQEICRRYVDKEGAVSIARSLSIDKKTVYNILSRSGIGTRPVRDRTGDTYHFSPHQKKWFMKDRLGRSVGSKLGVDEGVFDTLTPESCYWLGYLITDGCISEQPDKSARLVVQQSRHHRDQLERLRYFLKADLYKITDGEHFSYGRIHQHSVLQITAPRLCKVLATYGVVSRKTAVAGAVGVVEDNPNFWRGVVEGDGSVYVNKIHMYSSSPRLANQYRRFLRRHLVGVRMSVHKYADPVWRVCVTGESAVRVASLLYPPDACGLVDKRARGETLKNKKPRA